MPWPTHPPPVDPAGSCSRARAGNSPPYRVQRHHAPWSTTSSRWEALNAVPWPNPTRHLSILLQSCQPGKGRQFNTISRSAPPCPLEHYQQ